MSEAELKELAANIKVNGVQIPILLCGMMSNAIALTSQSARCA